MTALAIRRGMGLATATVVLWAISATALGQSLERRVQEALLRARLGGAAVGVSVLDVETGTELVSIETRAKDGDSRGYIPASNLKLLTSGAALAVLGADFEFRTTLLQDGDTLIVRGSGDPGLADPELLDQMKVGLDSILDQLVAHAKQAGAAGIREIVLDDRVFDREYVHPDWPRDQLHLSYCAEVSGLNFHANVLNVYVEPARSQPEAPWLVVKRSLKRVKQGENELRLDRDRQDPFTFKLSGNLRYAPDRPVQVTVHESSILLGKLLADRIVRDGMAAPGISGATMPVRLVSQDEARIESAGLRTLTVVRTPIAVVLERCNVDSDNLYAESLLKYAGHHVTGQPGSWANGTAVVRMQIRDRIGPEAASQVILSDGCGLSRSNRVTPGVMTRWLASMAADPKLGEVFIESLPTVGEGTLKKRFVRTKLRCEVRGKSGYIRRVRTLSGYVVDRGSGQKLAYSVLVNNVPADGDARSKEFHEDVVKLLDAYLADNAGTMSRNRERMGG